MFLLVMYDRDYFFIVWEGSLFFKLFFLLKICSCFVVEVVKYILRLNIVVVIRIVKFIFIMYSSMVIYMFFLVL